MNLLLDNREIILGVADARRCRRERVRLSAGEVLSCTWHVLLAIGLLALLLLAEWR